ncbi:MAG: hypothetical protein ACFWT2_00050 [Thermoanaerobacterium thermosaccharolyticum]
MKINLKFLFNFVFFFLFLSFNVIFIFNYLDSDNLVLLSFIIIFIMIIYNFTKYIFSKDIKFFELSFWFFVYIFLFFAPYLQTYYKLYPNTLSYNSNDVIYTNIVIIIFLIIYQLIRKIKIKKYYVLDYNKYNIEDKYTKISKLIFHLIFTINIITLIYVVKNFYLGGSLLTNRGLNINNDNIRLLLITKFLFNLPVFNLIYLIMI